jgi:hypothetical protein
MLSNKLDKTARSAEWATRRAALIAEVIRDLEALARDFAKDPTHCSPAPSSENTASVEEFKKAPPGEVGD